MNDPSTIAENRDALHRLAASGFARLLHALRDPVCYTRRGRGRIVIAALSRKMKISPQRTAELLAAARSVASQ